VFLFPSSFSSKHQTSVDDEDDDDDDDDATDDEDLLRSLLHKVAFMQIRHKTAAN
jgi:hypothetical protein